MLFNNVTSVDVLYSKIKKDVTYQWRDIAILVYASFSKFDHPILKLIMMYTHKCKGYNVMCSSCIIIINITIVTNIPAKFQPTYIVLQVNGKL